MERGEQRYLTYLEILRRELVPAMGCTEPVALAYCAAKARELLGTLPDRVEVEARSFSDWTSSLKLSRSAQTWIPLSWAAFT